MLKAVFDLFRKKSLKDHLSGTREVKVNGVYFKIKRIDILDYLEGAKVMQEIFSTFKTKDQKLIDDQTIKSLNKVKSYMSDIIIAGVVSPKIVRKDPIDGDSIHIDLIFQDWVLAQKLAEAIMNFTYGKKK